MKYIRVIDDFSGDEYLTTYKEHCEMVAGLQDSGFDFEGGIIKGAKTIEELFDEFVVYQPWTKSYYIGNTDIKNCILANIQMGYYKSFNYDNPVIYGAIWTDKGLIYVAKMKGILPNGEIDWELL